MITINKSKKTGQFIVVVTGKNNEKLCTSELLKTKQSAWKNIYAVAYNFLLGKDSDCEIIASFMVEDTTGKKSIHYVVDTTPTGFKKSKFPF